MSVKQIAVFIENKKGSLADVTRFIADHKINLRALSIADTQDFGILRIITDNPDNARDILREAGYTVTATSVLAVAIDDAPGAMASVLEILNDADVVIEYTYAFMSSAPGKAYMIFRVDNNHKATAALTAKGVSVLSQSDLF
ncbi:MAG: ACT domain-containing protein [Ruminococcaceae bacterium]|nr:ACT domain-containing protein [Oscillospiraceae bacterium]